MTNEVAKKIIRGITDKIECNTVDIDDWAEFWGFTREEYEEFFDMAIKALDQRWIPVSERLPETRDEVLVFLANGQITIASYNDHILPFFDKSIGWQVDPKRFVFYFCSDDVIAWMPLPESYRESEDAE